jgi:hypothetical protein
VSIEELAYEKEKQDFLEDYILDYKSKRGNLPKELYLDPTVIPKSCIREMVITIDDTDIPIIPTRPMQEVHHAS